MDVDISGKGRSGGLRAVQSEVAEKDREIMSLKMEVASLRERLSTRVGGDVTAQELEAENFTLRQNLKETQDRVAGFQRALKDFKVEYGKAQRNLAKMDAAWRSSWQEKQAKAKQVEQLVDEKKVLEEEIRQLKTSEGKEVEDDEKDKEMETFRQEMEKNEIKYRQELEVLEKEKKSVEEQLKAVQTKASDAENLEAECEELKRRIVAMERGQVASKEQISALQQTLERTREEDAKAKTLLAELESRNKELQEQVETYKSSKKSDVQSAHTCLIQSNKADDLRHPKQFNAVEDAIRRRQERLSRKAPTSVAMETNGKENNSVNALHIGMKRKLSQVTSIESKVDGTDVRKEPVGESRRKARMDFASKYMPAFKHV